MNIVFCVDISGSMCVTKEVPGRINLRGSMNAAALSRELGAEGRRTSMTTSKYIYSRFSLLASVTGIQYLPRERRDITYVSRLQSMQAAVDHQIQRMR